MQWRWAAAAMMLACAAAAPAPACRMHSPVVPADVRLADVVVVGRIANYRIVRDEEFRRRMLASPNLPEDLRAIYRDPGKTLMSDYARFDISVERVLAGRPGKRLSATWRNSTFALPRALPAGPLLIALSKPGGKRPPLRGPSATVLPSPEAGTLTVLQAPCSSPFLFAVNSAEARAVRRILGERRR